MQEVIGSTPIFSTHIEQTACHCGAPFFVSIHLARIGSKEPIEEARSHQRIECQNNANGPHNRGIPGWLENEERGQEEKGDDQSNDSFRFVLVGQE